MGGDLREYRALVLLHFSILCNIIVNPYIGSIKSVSEHFLGHAMRRENEQSYRIGEAMQGTEVQKIPKNEVLVSIRTANKKRKKMAWLPFGP